MQIKLCLVLALTIMLASCKKNSNDVLLKEEKIQLLINKKWQMTSDAYYFRGDNGTLIENNNFGGIAYIIDDYVIYHLDFTMEWNDNQVLDPNDSITVYTGLWHISDDGKIITTQLLSPVQLPAYSREILSITENEYKTTDDRVTPETTLTYFTTYKVVQ